MEEGIPDTSIDYPALVIVGNFKGQCTLCMSELLTLNNINVI